MNNGDERRGNIDCPMQDCDGKLASVVDSRPAVYDGRNTIRRRRQCSKCGHRVNTMEMPEWYFSGKAFRRRAMRRLFKKIAEEVMIELEIETEEKDTKNANT